MQLFILDRNPYKAAEAYADVHVRKIIVEAAQMMCTAYPAGVAPYKHTHVNHPCAKWVRACTGNFRWTMYHGFGLALQFEKRYGKRHKTRNVLEWIHDNPPEITDRQLEEFVQAIPQELRLPDPIDAYRQYYMTVKRPILKWEKGVQPPEWWR